MKCSSLKWNYFDLFRIGFFLCLWDGYLNSTSLSLVSGIDWKGAVSCPFPPDSSETEMSEMQAGSCNSKEGQPLQEGGAGPLGRALPDQKGRRSSWGHASTDGHRMVIPAFCRPVASCCLLGASSLGCFDPGQVVFSVPLCFIGMTAAVWVKLPQF